MLGHNSQGVFIEVEVRLFNSISRYANGGGIRQRVSLAAGSTVGDLLAQYGIPGEAVYLAFVNGRDITPSLNGEIRTGYELDEGDVIAFSGPVPYSWGYGSPVV